MDANNAHDRANTMAEVSAAIADPVSPVPRPNWRSRAVPSRGDRQLRAIVS